MTRWRSVALVSGASLASSGLALVVFVLAGRTLEADQFVDFAGIWGATFGLAAVLGGIELEVARQSASKQDIGEVTSTSVGLAVVLGLAGVFSAPFVADALRLAEPRLAYLIVIPLVAYPPLAVARGQLAGEGRLRSYAAVVVFENVLRLAAVLIPFASGTARFATAVAIGPLAFVPWIKRVVGPARRRWSWDSITRQLRAIGPLMSGNLGGAILITGLPATVLIVLGNGDTTGISIAITLAIVSRAPLLLLSSVYGLLVPWFVREDGQQHRPEASGMKLRPFLLGLAIVAALPIGAWLTVLFADVVIETGDRASFGAGLMFAAGAILLGVMQVTTARLVARGKHRIVQRMWWVSALVSVAIMLWGRLADGDVVLVLALALFIGPLVSVALQRGTISRENMRTTPNIRYE